VLGRTLSDGDTARALRDGGATGEFTVAPDTTTSGPVLLVEVVGKTPDAALATLGLILDQTPRTLLQLQRSIDVPDRAFITSTIINQDRASTVVRKSQIRAVLVAGVLGSGGTVFAISLLDGFLVRRRRRGAGRGARPVEDVAAGPEPVQLRRGRSRGQPAADQDDPRAAAGSSH
jgi:hypothetical protein